MATQQTRKNGFTTDRAPKKAAKSSKSSRPDVKSLEQEIRREAYLKYLNKGAKGGSDFDDWIEAEREIKRKHQIA